MKIRTINKFAPRTPRVVYLEDTDNFLSDQQANCVEGIYDLTSYDGLTPPGYGSNTLTQDTIVSQNNTCSCRGDMTADGSGIISAQAIVVDPNKTYRGKVFTMTDSESDTAQFYLQMLFYDSGGTLLSFTKLSSLAAAQEDWAGTQITGKAPATTDHAILKLQYDYLESGDKFWWSNASVIDANAENVNEVIGDVVTIDLPVGAGDITYDATTPQFTSLNVSGCGNSVMGQRRRYCYILNYLKYSGIKYLYYTGHKYTYDQVITKKIGNCCDLSRLVVEIASNPLETMNSGDTLTRYRYCTGNIKYKGDIFSHVWVELKLNGKWKVLDPTNYITRGVADVLGTIQGDVTYTYSGDPC